MLKYLLVFILCSCLIFIHCHSSAIPTDFDSDNHLEENLSRPEDFDQFLKSLVRDEFLFKQKLIKSKNEEMNSESIVVLEFSTAQPTSQPTSQPTGRPSSEPTSQPTKSIPITHTPTYGSWAPATTVQPMVFTVTQPVNGVDCDLLPLPADDLSALLSAIVATIKVPKSNIVNVNVECVIAKMRRILGSSFQPYLTYGVVVQNSQNFTNVVSNIVTTAQNGQLQQNILAAAQAQNKTALLQITVPPTPPQLSPLVQASSPSPSVTPSDLPSIVPSNQPSVAPSVFPSTVPSIQPSVAPSLNPTSTKPSIAPTLSPSIFPSNQPSIEPSSDPTVLPSTIPSTAPSLSPSISPSHQPSYKPSANPSFKPSQKPSSQPSSRPSSQPSPAAQSLSTLFSHGVAGTSEVSIVVVGSIVFAALLCALCYLLYLCSSRKRQLDENDIDIIKTYGHNLNILPEFSEKGRPDSSRRYDSKEQNTSGNQREFSSVDALEFGDVYESSAHAVIPPSPRT